VSFSAFYPTTTFTMTTTTSKFYDCDAGFNNWRRGWSLTKKEWCCNMVQRGCAEDETTKPQTTTPPPMTTHELAFDCNSDFDNWAIAWSVEQQDYCCRTARRGCAELIAEPIVAVPAAEPVVAVAPATTTSAPPSTTPGSSFTLFCWLVATSAPNNEVELVRGQYRHHVGIWQCNEARAYADVGDELAPGEPGSPRFINHGAAKSELSRGGQGWWMNVNIFANVWDMLIAEGAFRKYDATVKVDPDTVLIPERLRRMMEPNNPSEPWRIANCARWASMQGSLEVLSRAAVDQYAGAKGGCESRYTGGPAYGIWNDQPGEDMVLDKCLNDVGNRKIMNYDTLADANCGFDPGGGCAGPRKAAYHKFKDMASWLKCLNQAGGWMP